MNRTDYTATEATREHPPTSFIVQPHPRPTGVDTATRPRAFRSPRAVKGLVLGVVMLLLGVWAIADDKVPVSTAGHEKMILRLNVASNYYEGDVDAAYEALPDPTPPLVVQGLERLMAVAKSGIQGLLDLLEQGTYRPNSGSP